MTDDAHHRVSVIELLSPEERVQIARTNTETAALILQAGGTPTQRGLLLHAIIDDLAVRYAEAVRVKASKSAS